MLSMVDLKNDIRQICTDMNGISENGDRYFCDKFCDALQDYLAEAIITSATVDTGTASGGAYTGYSHGVTTGANKGIRLQKVPDPLDPTNEVYALSLALQASFSTPDATDAMFALMMANDINTALLSASISVTTTGTTVIGEVTSPASCDGHGVFTGVPLTISAALATSFASMLFNAQEQTPGYDGNDEFAETMASSIHAYMVTPGCLSLIYASVTPPFACTSVGLVS